MKLLFGWLILIFLILYAFYYVNINLEKTTEVKDFLKIYENEKTILYSVRNSENENEIIDLNISKDSEIIVISGEKIFKKEKSNDINLLINRPNKNVILILNVLSNIKWNIEVTENTNIQLIMYNKNHSKVLSKENIFKTEHNFEYFNNVENIKFIKMLSYLNKTFEINKISNFYYEKELSDNITIDIDDKNEKYSLNYLKTKEINDNFNFELISEENEFIKFNLHGPIFDEDREKGILDNITYSPDKSKFYQITNNGLKIIDIKSKKETLKPIPTIDKIINPKGIAYDSLSERVFIANEQGEFYIFDAYAEIWLSIRKYIKNYDIGSLSYDILTNTYISSTRKNKGLIFFDQAGNFDRKVKLQNKLVGINYYLDEQNKVPELLVIPNGEQIALVLIDKFVEKIWYYDRSRNDVYLTYNYYSN